MASLSLQIFLVMLGGLSNFYGGATDTCLSQQKSKKRIDLCHERPRPKPDGPYQCDTQDKGFVLDDLMIAPHSTFDDCGAFSTDGFWKARCLKEQQPTEQRVAGIETAVFDLLDKVSGKSQVDNNTVVDRMTFVEPVTASSSSSSGKERSSAFISFRQLCKPVRPAKVQRQGNGVIKVCGEGNATGAFVFLAFHGADDLDDLDLPSDAPFRCRCTLIPSHTLTLRALDIRLQRSDNRACSGTTVTIHSENQTSKSLACRGLSALYDSEVLFSSQKEVTLDLSVSAGAPPTSLWIQGSQDDERSLDPIIVSCKGFTRVKVDPAAPEEEGDEGNNLALIIGSVVGGIIFVIVVVVVVVLIKRKKICNREQPTVVEHVYAEPGAPSSFRKPSDVPVTPPPLPSTPPPGAPLVNDAPAKPSRTFSYRQDPGSGDATSAEEYDTLLRSGDAGAKRDSRNGSTEKRRIAERYSHLELNNQKNDGEK